MDGLINRLEAGIAWCERVRREIPCGRAIQRKIVALLGIPASLQMARRVSLSASRSQIDMATWAL
jgi:hypothetical protein